MQRSKAFQLFTCLALAGCQSETADRTPSSDTSVTAAQETVLVAQARYNPAMFDTVNWVTDSAHLARGADVYRWVCAECHGPTGKGDGRAVLHGDTLNPPSFLAPEWRFADDEQGLRRRIFVGNARGMPHFGLRKMQASDILAVQKYIMLELRKDVNAR